MADGIWTGIIRGGINRHASAALRGDFARTIRGVRKSRPTRNECDDAQRFQDNAHDDPQRADDITGRMDREAGRNGTVNGAAT